MYTCLQLHYAPASANRKFQGFLYLRRMMPTNQGSCSEHDDVTTSCRKERRKGSDAETQKGELQDGLKFILLSSVCFELVTLTWSH